jgi:hypothetical protein
VLECTTIDVEIHMPVPFGKIFVNLLLAANLNNTGLNSSYLHFARIVSCDVASFKSIAMHSTCCSTFDVAAARWLDGADGSHALKDSLTSARTTNIRKFPADCLLAHSYQKGSRGSL